MELQFTDVALHIDKKPILSAINCGITRGSFVAVIGENGAGKSALLQCVHTHLHTVTGDIFIDGKSLKHTPRKSIAQNISAVLQETPTDLGLSVRQMVMMGRYPHLDTWQTPNHIDTAFVKTALRKVNLLRAIDQPFATLSGGQKQRVYIARALAQTPQVLILDEPTNHLDIKQQIDILKLVKSMHITVLASLHDLNITASYADYVICMKGGKIVYQGTPAHILTPDIIYDLFGIHTTVHMCEKRGVPHIHINYT